MASSLSVTLDVIDAHSLFDAHSSLLAMYFSSFKKLSDLGIPSLPPVEELQWMVGESDPTSQTSTLKDKELFLDSIAQLLDEPCYLKEWELNESASFFLSTFF